MSLSWCLFTSLEQSHATRHPGKEGGGWGGPEEKEERDGQLGLGAEVSRPEGSALSGAAWALGALQERLQKDNFPQNTLRASSN